MNSYINVIVIKKSHLYHLFGKKYKRTIERYLLKVKASYAKYIVNKMGGLFIINFKS